MNLSAYLIVAIILVIATCHLITAPDAPKIIKRKARTQWPKF